MSGMTDMDGWMRDVADAAASLDKRGDRQMSARLMRLHRDMDIARLRGEAQSDGKVVYQAKDETLGAWFDLDKALWDNYDSHLRRALYTRPQAALSSTAAPEPAEELDERMASMMEHGMASWCVTPATAAPAPVAGDAAEHEHERCSFCLVRDCNGECGGDL